MVLFDLKFAVRPLFLVRDEIDDDEVTCADLVSDETELLLTLPSDAITEYCEVRLGSVLGWRKLLISKRVQPHDFAALVC